MTPAELNAMHRKFWSRECKLLEQRMAVPLVANAVLKQLRDEQLSRPVAYRGTIEEIANSYDSFRRDVLAQRAVIERKRVREAEDRGARVGLHRMAVQGGRASKGDALKRYIDQKVAENPAITAATLACALRAGASDRGFDWLDEVNESEICLVSGKDVPLSALKHRLSRAKKVCRRSRAKRVPRFGRCKAPSP